MLIDRDEASLASLRGWIEEASVASFEKNSQAMNMLLPSMFVALHGSIADAKLARLYRHQWVRNQRTIQAGLGASQQLHERGIRAALIQGVPLALFYYGEIGSRVMTDAELVVSDVDMPRANEILASSGWTYRSTPPEARIWPYLMAVEYQLPRVANLRLRRSPFFAATSASAVQRFWASCVERSAGGLRALIPSASCMLLLACVHGRSGELHARVQWILDADAILRQQGGGIDWDDLTAMARETETLPLVRDALSYLADELALPIPREMLKGLERIPESRARLRRQARLRPGAEDDGAVDFLEQRWAEYAAGRRREGKRPHALGFAVYCHAYLRAFRAHPVHVSEIVWAISKEWRRLGSRSRSPG